MLSCHIQTPKRLLCCIRAIKTGPIASNRAVLRLGRDEIWQARSPQFSRSLARPSSCRTGHNHCRWFSTQNTALNDAEGAKYTPTERSLVALLSGASAAIGLAESEYNTNKEEKNVSGESNLALPADPWLLTGKKPKLVEESSDGFLTRLFNFLWGAFKLVTGISLFLILYRACKTFFYELKEYRLQHLVSKIFLNSTRETELGARVDPYILAIEVCQLVSEYAGSGSSYAGVLEALQQPTIDSLPSSLIPTRNRPTAVQLDWTHPYISTDTYEELLLSPQYMSFLAESKRDGAVYRVDGYVSLTDSFKPIPLILFYSKVSSSLTELKRGNVGEKWHKRLMSGSTVGSSVDAERDMSMDLRAFFLSSDLSRLLADDDWTRYIGCSREKATLMRDRPTAASDVWRFQGPSGEIVADITANPRASASSINITFPETSTSLESTVLLSAASVYCARLCTYVERHPVLKHYLGPDVKVISSPTIVESVTEGGDFSGSITELWCTLAGTSASLELHMKIGRDTQQDGTLPIAPVLAIWAETEQLGRLDFYRNPRPRYQHMVERRVSIPVVAEDRPMPLVNQIQVLNRDEEEKRTRSALL